MTFTPTLMLGDRTHAIPLAETWISMTCSFVRPVLPITIGFPAAAASFACATDEPAWVKSIATSARAIAEEKSLVTATPAFPTPAASKASCPNSGCPWVSTAPDKTRPWGRPWRTPRIARPILPIAPQTTTFAIVSSPESLQMILRSERTLARAFRFASAIGERGSRTSS